MERSRERTQQSGVRQDRKQEMSRAQAKPQMIQIIEKMLEQQGIEYYEKNVGNQLIEFMNYYGSELISEAKALKDYAKKKAIDVNDVRLAIHERQFNAFTRPLPITFMRSVANEKNMIPLPKIEDITTLPAGPSQKLSALLPPNEQCQISPNIQVYSEEQQKEVEEKLRKAFNRNPKQIPDKTKQIIEKKPQVDQNQKIQYSLLGKRPHPQKNHGNSSIQFDIQGSTIFNQSTMIDESNHQDNHTKNMSLFDQGVEIQQNFEEESEDEDENMF